MNRKRLSTGIIFAFIIILAGAFPGCDKDDDDNDGAQWTFMVYMAADNSLSYMGVFDILEMEKVGSTDKVHIIVQAEFAAGQPGVPAEGTLRGRITKGSSTTGITSDLQSLGNKDMGDPATLSEFISWTADNYPAEKYALIIWDHGGGWKEGRKGACEDQTSGTWMTLPELRQGMEDSGVRLDLIEFDACLMGMYEVAYEFAGLADVMTFSEEVEAGEGDPYDSILAILIDDPGMSAEDLGKHIVEEFYKFYQGGRSSATKSAVSLSYMDDLHPKIQDMGARLSIALETYRSQIEQAQRDTQEYAYPSNIDLGHLASLLRASPDSGVANNAAEIYNMINQGELIIANRAYSGTADSDVSRSSGLAIWFPAPGEASRRELEEYYNLKINQSSTTWLQFLIDFLSGSTTEDAVGQWRCRIYWDTDSDLDLYIGEIDPYNLYAPWMGPSTPNGLFSADSVDSGVSQEAYYANDYVQAGNYYILVNYYEHGSTNYANVYFEFYDDYWGGYEKYGPEYMNLAYPLDPYGDPYNDECSDWWYVGYVQRSSAGQARFIPYNGEPTGFSGTLKRRQKTAN